MKYFRMSYEEVVFNRSYINILLLNRSIPSYKTNVKDDEETPLERGKRRKNEAKTYRKADVKHPNDFFMQFM